MINFVATNRKDGRETQMTYRELWQRLLPIYDAGEAKAIARMVFEVHFGLSMSDVLMGHDADVPNEELEPLASRLEKGEPIQYVIGKASFCDRFFHVEPGVLIPRPETMGLCELVTRHLSPEIRQPALLDIGTGSGCIAITLALEWPQAEVTAWDMSEKALQVARGNAERLGAHLLFERRDALQLPADSNRWDVIVSNPPYICERERKQMDRHVLDWEPPLALFVPDDDPLRFYLSIGQYAIKALRPNGFLATEINEQYGNEMQKLMKDIGFAKVKIYKDAYDKDRFAIAYK